MTVKELKEALDEFGDHLEVYLTDELTGAYHLVDQVDTSIVDDVVCVVVSVEG